MWSELWLTWTELWLTVVTAVVIYVAVIVFSRVWGQRQFTSSSTYDLAFIFAIGSLVGRVILVRTSLGTALVGLLVMFGLHAGTGWLHHNVDVVHDVIQNKPVLLMAGSDVLDDNLQLAHTSRLELYQAVRLRGVGSFDQVVAAVLERNGQISVVRRGEPCDRELFTEVVGADRLVVSS